MNEPPVDQWPARKQLTDSTAVINEIKRRFWQRIKPAFRLLTLRRPRRNHRRSVSMKLAVQELAKFPKHPNPPRHTLPGQLVVSLTSFPPRFSTLHLTLRSLLDQAVRPDALVLWVAHEDYDRLPEVVTSLQNETFQIRTWEDIRSFKKIIPTLLSYPGAFIVIADDDTYYPDDWLRLLVETYDHDHPTIVCRRAHRVRYNRDGRIAPYRRWRREVSGAYTHKPRTDLLPTGNGGVLYPPGSLPPEATDMDLIRRLSATSDDVWLYFMWRRAGWTIKRVPGPTPDFFDWPNSQSESLRSLHATGKKDEHLVAMAEYFGVP